MAFMQQLLQTDEGAAQPDNSDEAEPGMAIPPRTPALPQRATSRQPAPPSDPDNQPTDGEVLPPVQMDRLAFEQLARLSHLGQLPNAVQAAATSQPHMPAPRRQRHQDEGTQRAVVQQPQLEPPADAQLQHHSRAAAEAHWQQQRMRGRMSDLAAAADVGSRPRPPHSHSSSGQSMLPRQFANQQPSLRPPATDTAADAAAAVALLTRPGDSRVRQALRTLYPAVHTLGDLAAVAGTAALAEASTGCSHSKKHTSNVVTC